MLISKEYKFIFFHIPKTGGTATLRAFAPFIPDIYGKMGKYPKAQRDGWGGWQLAYHHKGIHRRFEEVASFVSNYKRYYKFTLVRNPWERVVSLWKRYGRELSMYDFLRRVEVDDTMTTHGILRWNQLDWITDFRRKVAMDFIGHTETLEEDVTAVARHVGITAPLEIMRFNTNAWHLGDIRTRFDLFKKDKEIELAARIYQKDISYFKYTFEEEKR